jgi:hypothetical protein
MSLNLTIIYKILAVPFPIYCSMYVCQHMEGEYISEDKCGYLNGEQIIFIYRSSYMTYQWVCIKSNTMGETTR